MKMSDVEAADSTEKVGGEAEQWSEVGYQQLEATEKLKLEVQKLYSRS